MTRARLLSLIIGSMLTAAVTSPALAKDSPAPVAVPPPPVPLPPAPAVTLPVVKATAESSALALELASMLNSEAITHRQLEIAYTETLPKVMKGNAEFQQLEKVFPGISDAAIKAEREIVEPWTMEQLPGLCATIAEIYSSHLTAAELQDVLAFYHGPVGAKALSSIAEGSDMSAIASKNIADDQYQLTGDDLRQATGAAALPGLLKSLNVEETRALFTFGMTPAGRKWNQLQKLVFPKIAEYQNSMSGDVKTRAQQHVVEAITKFIADQKTGHDDGK